MMRRLIVGTAALTLVFGLSGCQKQREMEVQLQNLEASVPKQFGLLKQQNEFVNRKLNKLNDKIEELTERNIELSDELATYANRPDEVKVEIINEVNTRFGAIAKAQTDFQANITQEIEENNKAIEEQLTTKFAEMDKLLTHHTTFVNFVAAEQDSLNREIATRIDDRPWYQSIIGKWDDRERQAQENP